MICLIVPYIIEKKKLMCVSVKICPSIVTIIFSSNIMQCFSTGVPRNLMVSAMASKSSAESNREMGTKRYLWPLQTRFLDIQNAFVVGAQPQTPLGELTVLPQTH